MAQKNNHILARLEKGDAVSLYDYMRFCLVDETYGYYRNQTSIGKGGDFTTSPEISQIFGESIGFWLLDLWHRCGEPNAWTLVELGGGRGSLMLDVLSLIKKQPAAFAGLKIIMVDINPHFRDLQKTRLAAFGGKIEWCTDLSEVSPASIMAVIGNEFLDALAIRQFEYKDAAWHERHIIKEGDKLRYVLEPTSFAGLPSEADRKPLFEGAIFEYAPELPQVMQKIAALAQAGGALLIDYGYGEERRLEDSLQAVREQNYADILPAWEDLQKPDKIPDLSAHVNFAEVRRLAQAAGLACSPLMNQHEFLGSMGGALRLQKLLPQAQDKEALLAGYERISDSQGMGGLFKVLMLYGENPAHAD